MKVSHWVLIAFVLFKMLLQYVLVSPEYDLQRDEYLHLDQANHLAWGYLSLPPATSWLAWIIKMLGASVFWVRFFPALFGALTLVVVWKGVTDLGGGLMAKIMAASGVLFSALLRLNILFQPNALDILCWTLLLFFLMRYLLFKEAKWLYWGAVILALGFLNKYSILVLLIGLLLALPLYRTRRIFLEQDLYLAGLLSLVLVSPNLFWQYQNGFPLLSHMSELRANQLVHNSASDFLTQQLLFFAGALLLILGGLLAPFRMHRLKNLRFMTIAMLLVLALMAALGAKGYYSIGLYPIYLALGAVFLENILRKSNYYWLLYPLALLPLSGIIPVYEVLFPNKSPEYIASHPENYEKWGMLRWEDGKQYSLPQDFADMLGWKELALRVDSIYAQLPDSEATLLLCDNYGQAGAINYYGKLAPRANSFNADYLNWWKLDRPYKHLIRVISARELEAEIRETAAYFDSYEVMSKIMHPHARERGTAIVLFSHALGDVNAVLKEEITARQRAYRAY